MLETKMHSDHYGLTGRPFQLTPDARFWFESATHKKAMAYLGYGLQQGEGFIVVTGEIGAGKTTLTGHLMTNVDRSRVNAIKIVSTQLDRDDLLRTIAANMGIAVDDTNKAQLLGRIEAFIRERAGAGQKTLLIVDEAQNLPIESLEELRMLSNFQADGRAMLQIFLLGQPEFRDRLNASDSLEQLRQRVIATHHLTSMDADEVGPYVEHRMKLVGWQGVPAFSQDAFAALYRYSGGVPRKINNLMTRVLMLAGLDEAARIDGALIDAVIDDLGHDEAGDVNATPGGYSTVAIPNSQALDLAARVAMLEANVEEQGAALRRVLSLLVDWVESDDAPRVSDSRLSETHPQGEIRRAPAA
jgi:general secretion pathway protein A